MKQYILPQNSLSRTNVMITLEFHCHTYASKNSLTRPADLIKTARRKGLNRLVITDHNSITGALEAREIDPELVIVGEEIMTTSGEILRGVREGGDSSFSFP